MYVVCIEVTGGNFVRTAEMTVKLDVAKQKADFVASDMPDIVRVTVRHHKRTGEVFYSTVGTMNQRT